jgi:hypothetical protein
LDYSLHVLRNTRGGVGQARQVPFGVGSSRISAKQLARKRSPGDQRAMPGTMMAVLATAYPQSHPSGNSSVVPDFVPVRSGAKDSQAAPDQPLMF